MNSEVSKVINKLELDSEAFLQIKTIKQIEKPFSEVWTVVYSLPTTVNNSTAIYSCFASPSQEEHILDGQDWLKRPGDFSPGFSVHGNETSYFTGQGDGFEPVIIEQYFHTLQENQLILNQEFVLLLELYKGNDGNYYLIGDSGEKSIAVSFDNSCVRIKTKLLQQYMSAKQIIYVQFIDSHVSTPGRYPHDSEVIDNQIYRGDSYNFFNCYQSNKDRTYLLSMIYARSVVKPEAVEKCGIWPYDDNEEEYPEFIIKEFPDGSYERFSCNKSGLGNYFGANPDAPHYLTPIYFKPEVLDKYRKNPLFEVSERRLTCGSQWGVEIDNLDPKRVMVFLGDLGRDLPEMERKHFLQYEISPTDQSISDEVIANDFFCLFTDPSGPISVFLNTYRKLNEAWTESFGWSLYREYHDDDIRIQQRIRIPTNNSQEEFETVILNLAKMLIDYIDVSKLQGSNRDGSINKLEDFLKSKEVDIDFSALRNLQALRSTGVAHSKGEKYERQKSILLTGNAIKDAESIIADLSNFMRLLTNTIVRV